jgi:hypothetical protein
MEIYKYFNTILTTIQTCKRAPQKWCFGILALTSPLGFAASDFSADINGDAIVDSRDISQLSSCFGQDSAEVSTCNKADVDEDGDIDRDDFSFVSSRLGQQYPSILFPSHQKTPTGSWNYKSVQGDVNGDGKLDILLSISGGLRLFLGNGNDTFQTPQDINIDGATDGINEFLWSGLDLGDIDGDGSLDVALVFWLRDEVTVLKGNGDGSFQMPRRFAVGGQPNSVLLEDLNGDNTLDIVTANSESRGISVLLGNGDGSFQDQQHTVIGERPFRMAFGELNGDGALDMVTMNMSSSEEHSRDISISVLHGEGDGRFQEHQHIVLSPYPDTVDSAGAPNWFALEDMDGDGQLDLVANKKNSNLIEVFPGNDGGGFDENQDNNQIITQSGGNFRIGDLNSDGNLDLAYVDKIKFVSPDDDYEAYPKWVTTFEIQFGDGQGDFQGFYRQPFVIPTVFDSSLGDLNGDGVPDVTLLNPSSILPMINNGDGTFHKSKTVDRYGSMGDVNGDGKLDIVARTETDFSLQLGNGDGTFQPLQHFGGGYAENNFVVLGDVNSDGKLDVLGDNEVLLGNSDGTFQQSHHFTRAFSEMVIGDLNRDGALDIVGSGNVSFGNGDGTFQNQQQIGTFSHPVIGDINGDSIPDIVGVATPHELSVILSRGNGSFQEPKLFDTNINADDSIASVHIGDVDGDGNLDVIGTKKYLDWPYVVSFNLTYSSFVLLGDGDGSFRDLSSNISFTSTLEFSNMLLDDINNDGNLDIITSYDSYFSIRLGNGDSTFQEPQDFQVIINNEPKAPERSMPMQLGDVNGDGRLDVLMSSGSSDESAIIVLSGSKN